MNLENPIRIIAPHVSRAQHCHLSVLSVEHTQQHLNHDQNALDGIGTLEENAQPSAWCKIYIICTMDKAIHTATQI